MIYGRLRKMVIVLCGSLAMLRALPGETSALAQQASKTPTRVEAVDFEERIIYHSPETPGWTCWVGLWQSPDGPIECGFCQITGPRTSKWRLSGTPVERPGEDVDLRGRGHSRGLLPRNGRAARRDDGSSELEPWRLRPAFDRRRKDVEPAHLLRAPRQSCFADADPAVAPTVAWCSCRASVRACRSDRTAT